MDPHLIDVHAAVADRHWWFVGRGRILGALAERLLPESGATVVDLGCGVGANTAVLAGSHSCVGFDASERAIAHASRLHPDVRFVQMDVFEVPPEVSSADLILLMDVLEHVEEDRVLLERLVSVARPGAHLILTVPAAPELWSAHDVASGHVRRYDLAGFAGLWDGLPVEQRMLSHFNTRLFPVAKAVRVARRALRRDDGTGRSDLVESLSPINGVLAAVFSGERRRLVGVMDGGRPYRSGLSLIAALQRVDA